MIRWRRRTRWVSGVCITSRSWCWTRWLVIWRPASTMATLAFATRPWSRSLCLQRCAKAPMWTCWLCWCPRCWEACRTATSRSSWHPSVLCSICCRSTRTRRCWRIIFVLVILLQPSIWRPMYRKYLLNFRRQQTMILGNSKSILNGSHVCLRNYNLGDVHSSDNKRCYKNRAKQIWWRARSSRCWRLFCANYV